MQLLPGTGEDVAGRAGVDWQRPGSTLFDPVANVRLGVTYLDELIHRFGDVEVALAAYNWGPTRISQMMTRGRAACRPAMRAGGSCATTSATRTGSAWAERRVAGPCGPDSETGSYTVRRRWTGGRCRAREARERKVRAPQGGKVANGHRG